MMPASNKGVGMNFCFPDILPSAPPIPPMPIPWPNLGMNALAVPFSPNVLVGFMPALTMASVIPVTMGDQGGLVSGHIMLPGTYTMGNPTVYVNCVPAVNLLAPAAGNAMNAFAGAAVVPSITTTFYNDQAALDAVGTELTLDGMRWLEDEVTPSRQAIEARRLGDVVVVRLARITRDAAARVAESPSSADVRGLVLDLRGCPGGDLRAALSIADDFLPAGRALALRLEAGDELDDATPLLARAPKCHDVPMVVLVDGGTASAAEILARALGYHRRAVVLGTRTAGKATVQAALPVEGATSRYGSVAELLGPDGARLQGVGVIPDGPAAAGVDDALLRLAALA